MLKRIYIILPAIAFAGISAIMLPGCGGDEYQTEEKFLESVRANSSDAEAVGTLPPVGESMDQVAQIRVETTELDVGVIANDRPHFTKLKVYNDGKYPLKITKIDTSCACTQGSIDPQRATIQPGEESWIDVMVDPNRISGFDSHKVLTITSTDPERGQVQVGVTAKVDPEFELESTEVEVGDLEKGESVERTIRFRQIQEEPITISKVEPMTAGPANPKLPGVAAELIEVPESEWKVAGKREYDIKLTIGPEIPSGEFVRSVLLTSDVKRFKIMRILVTGTVVAPYQILPTYPDRATLAPTGAGLRAEVTFIADSAITLTNIRAENPALQVEAVPGATASEAKLRITTSSKPPGGPLDEIVRLQVNVDGRAYEEFIGVRTAGAPLPAGHSPGDGHNH